MNSREASYRKRLNTEYLIGCYHHEGGRACLTDLRGKAGQRVQRPDGSPVESTSWFSHNDQFVEGEYYQFEWGVEGSLDNYEFVNRGNVRPLDKKALLDTRLQSKLSQSDENRQDELQHQEMINREVTGAPHTYIYELLQNANDYPQRDSLGNKLPVSVRFILSEHYLFFAHTGDRFRLPNIVAICTVNEGDKRAKTDTIGYKGMGFKSVFVKNDYAYLQSGEWSLRFDRKHIKTLDEFEMPWQYMPIYTEPSELDDEVTETMKSIGDEMLVKFAFRHNTDASENEPNLETVFTDERILIFIPYVDDVRVNIHGKERYHVVKDRNRWIIEHQDFAVSDEYKEILEKSLKNDNKIPEKFRKIENIRISFAVRKEGNKLLPVEDAKVYNYLPTEDSLSLPFLLNADFVPNASRNGLPLIDWNKKLLYEAGQRYARWWASFMKEPEKYNLNSVFSLLPEAKNVNALRKAFMEGFESEILTIPCIPVLFNGEYNVVPINQIILDSKGMVSNEAPVMTDEFFYELTSYDAKGCFLPHPEIRLNSRLIALLNLYSSHIGCEMRKDDYIHLSYSPKLVEWIKSDVNNAIVYYDFLFRSSLIYHQLECNDCIFLTETLDIKSPKEMYFDVEGALMFLYRFDDYLPRLHSAVRKALYDKFISCHQCHFKEYSSVDLADEICEVFDQKQYKDRITSKEDSLSFLNFLATANHNGRIYTRGIPATMPIYLDDETVHYGTQDLYIKDSFGLRLIAQSWINKEWIHFIYSDYVSTENVALSRFMRDNALSTLTPQIAWSDIITEDNRLDVIAKSIEDRAVNIEFYHFLMTIEKEVVLGTDLKNKLVVFANDGTYEALIPISMQMYWEDDLWTSFLKETWLPKQCCWAIDNEYTDSLPEGERESLRKFFTSKFIANKFSISDFFNKCLSGYWKEVIELITNKEMSFDLLRFLYNHRSEISGSFKKERYQDIPLFYKDEENEGLCMDDLSTDEVIYQPSETLDILCDESWFDSCILTILDDIYAPLFETKEGRDFFNSIGIRTFDLLSYVKESIIRNLESYENILNGKSENIAFHSFMGNLFNKFSKEDLDELKKAPIYISSVGNSDGTLCDSSTNHYLPSKLLTQIIQLDIIPIKLLDSVLPEYCTDKDSKEYLLGLGNCELAEDNFFQYIGKHKDEVGSYIKEDRKRNIRFWRWVVDFNASAAEMASLRGLPVLSVDNYVYDCRSLYVSDGFTNAKDTVEIISKFIDKPLFLSEDYLEDGVDRNWHPLLMALNVNVTSKHIVLNKLIPQLDKYRDKSVIYSMALYVSSITKWIEENDEERLKQLENLHLLCEDGEVRKIKETLVSGAYVGLSNSMYPDIVIGNLVSDIYIKECGNNVILKEKVIKLLVNISRRFGKLRNDARVLRDAKIKYFLENQEQFTDIAAHCRIIAQLANDYKKDGDDEAFRKLFEGRNVSLLNVKDERELSTSLYFSPAYKPSCDFMSHGVTASCFVSEVYTKYGDTANLKKFFHWQLGVCEEFSQSILDFLLNEEFSRYFWEEYLTGKNSLDYVHLINEDTLGNKKCIPTKLGVMQAPRNLYDSRLDKLVKMVSAIGKRDALIPDVKIPSGYLIGMRGTLTFEDCLLYLKTENPAYREIVYKTIVDLATNRPDKLNAWHKQGYVTRFRAEARWYSGSKKWLPVKNLVALEWAEGHSLLKDNFGGSEIIVSKMPDGKDDYNKLCEILQIPIITDEDFDHNYGEGSRVDPEASQEISKRLMYLAFKHFGESWEEEYAKIQQELAGTDIHRCDHISYFCTSVNGLSADLLSYTEDLNTLWYVGDWNGAMFVDIVEWTVKKFPFLKAFDFGFVKNCFFKPFNQFLKDRESGSLPEEFLKNLSENDKTGLVADEYDENLIDEEVEQAHEYSEFDENPGEGTDKSEAEKNEESEYTSSHNNGETQKKDKFQSATTTSSDGIDANIAVNNGSSSDHESSATVEKEEKSFREQSHERWENDAKKHLDAPTSAQTLVKNDGLEAFNPEEKTKTDAEYGKAYDENAKRNNISTKPKVSRRDVSDREVKRAKEEERNARNKMSRREMLNEVPKYSLEWFNYRLDVCLEDQKSYSGRQVVLDFHDWCLVDSEHHIYRLVSPDGYIPISFADYNNQIVKIISNGKEWTVDARVLEADDSGIDLLCSSQLGEPMEGRRIQISATSTGGFNDHLVARFRRLSDQFNMATDLRMVFPNNISFIYGPPGTGKTHEVVNQISDIVRNHYKVKILVLTPTNRAADEVAERLCRDTFVKEHLARYGVTESRELAEHFYDKLRNRQNMDISANKTVMVTTIARYPYDTVRKGQISYNIFEEQWDYIIVDEASMIDIIDISLLLLNKKAKQFIIAGDPNQIRPITPFDIEQCNIYDMIEMKSFRDAINNRGRYPVKALDVQYRSVPEIGTMVSQFCYQGLLRTNPTREKQKPLHLTGLKVETANTIGFNVEKFSYLYGWNKVDDSPVHVYSAIFAYEFAGYIAKEIAKNHPDKKYSIGIVTPYGKQKEAIKQLLEQKPVGTANCEIKCGTAHSFQGGECDIMIVVMNYPDIYASEMAHINNKNIMNVAMSRARDFLFFLWPEVKEEHCRKGYSDKLPYLMNQQIGDLMPKNFNQLHAFDIEEVMFGDKTYIAKNSGTRCHLPVNVSSQSQKRYEIRLSDNALDIQIND